MCARMRLSSASFAENGYYSSQQQHIRFALPEIKPRPPIELTNDHLLLISLTFHPIIGLGIIGENIDLTEWKIMTAMLFLMISYLMEYVIYKIRLNGQG